MAHRPIIDNAAHPKRSNQNLSCNWTGSADFGRLVPIHWEELLETDKVITCRPKIECQMLSFASPSFSKIDLYCHYFAVPIRQLCEHFYQQWSRTGEFQYKELPWVSPNALAEAYIHTTVPEQKRAFYKHWTSMGLNPFFELGEDNVTDTETPISLLPFLAYNKIWFDFYRDPEVVSDASAHAYLGNDLEVGGTFPTSNYAYAYMSPHIRSIKNNWISDLFARSGLENAYFQQIVNLADASLNPAMSNGGSGMQNLQANLSGSNPRKFSLAGNVNVPGTNDVIGSTTIGEPELRKMEALTRLAERLSLSGKREIEQLFSRFGVKPRWAEMNLCRYLGGAKATVMTQDIIATADTDSAPLGSKAGAGFAALNNLNIQCTVDEPSILMGIVSIMPHIHYVQGLSKKWQRKTVDDMFNDKLQFTGNVAVAKREVAFKYRDNQDYNPANDAETFAFTDPYYEYKMGMDILAGDFMKYHNVELPTDPTQKKDVMYMQSMEQYIDFPFTRQFNLDNLLVDGDQFNKVFNYLGGSIWEDVDDHFFLCIDKEVVINRPMEGFAIPTLETTADPHAKSQGLSQDKIL